MVMSTNGDGIPELGARIHAICKQHGGVSATADLLGVRRPRLASWCEGHSEPSCVYLRKLAHLGEVSVDWLLSDARDGAQEMAWSDVRRGMDGILRAVVTYVEQERRYCRPEAPR